MPCLAFLSGSEALAEWKLAPDIIELRSERRGKNGKTSLPPHLCFGDVVAIFWTSFCTDCFSCYFTPPFLSLSLLFFSPASHLFSLIFFCCYCDFFCCSLFIAIFWVHPHGTVRGDSGAGGKVARVPIARHGKRCVRGLWEPLLSCKKMCAFSTNGISSLKGVDCSVSLLWFPIWIMLKFIIFKEHLIKEYWT